MKRLNLSKLEGFEWDNGNKNKNWKKHKVTDKEAEEVFFDSLSITIIDTKHSVSEKRFHHLGKTSRNKILFISSTIRNNKIRIISARPVNHKERRIYEKKAKNNSTI